MVGNTISSILGRQFLLNLLWKIDHYFYQVQRLWMVLCILTPKSRNGYQAINVKRWQTWRLQTLAVTLPKQCLLLCYFLTFFLFHQDYIRVKYTLFSDPVMSLLWQLYKNVRMDAKIMIFPIPIARWSGFGIFEQNRGNPDEIGMAGQSESFNMKLLSTYQQRDSSIHFFCRVQTSMRMWKAISWLHLHLLQSLLIFSSIKTCLTVLLNPDVV